jgi:glycerophosphoryl diester phosphodiesterase
VSGAIRPFRVIGHRGAAGHAAENTLRSFARAIELGAPWIELDAQLHQGELLIFHDLRLDRTTNGRGRLTDHDLAHLRSLDAGGGERIPTLKEALDLIDRRAGVNIELKTWNGTAAAVADEVRARLAQGWTPEQFLVSSFVLPELREFRRRLPEVPLGALYDGVPLDLAASAQALGACCVNLSAEFLDTAMIEDARARGLAVYVYTVNEPDDIEAMRALGVDGLFTDFPDRVLPAS